MTDQDCTCETDGFCDPCRPEPPWHRMTDAELLEECSKIARRRIPAEMTRAKAAYDARFPANEIRHISPAAMQLRRAWEANDDDALKRWVKPDDPSRLTKEASGLLMETMHVPV